jgi:hypothetical protein
MEPINEKQAREAAAGLRELADFVEANPEFAKAFPAQINVSSIDRNEFVRLARKLGRAKKVDDGSFIVFRRSFGPVQVDVFALKAVTCNRVLIEEKVIPAEPETVVPAKPERVERVYGWKCPDSFLDEGGDHGNNS